MQLFHFYLIMNVLTRETSPNLRLKIKIVVTFSKTNLKQKMCVNLRSAPLTSFWEIRTNQTNQGHRLGETVDTAVHSTACHPSHASPFNYNGKMKFSFLFQFKVKT